MEKQLIIKPITKPKFSGLSSYSKTVTTFTTQLDSTGLYKTGLSKEEEIELCSKANLKEGTLNKRNGDYWGKITIRLNNDKPTPITILGAEDEIKERVIRNHSKIATSVLDMANKPEALFYIDDPEAVAQKEALHIDAEMEAMEAMFKTTVEDKRGLLRLYGKSETHKMSESMIKAELSKRIKADPKDFLSKINDKTLKTKMLIEELIEIGLFKKKGPYYYNGEDLLGSSTDEIVGYLSDIKNQSVRLNLETKLKKYREGK